MTKRKSLGAAGEQVYRIAGPALPDGVSEVGDGTGETVAAAKQNNAVRDLCSLAGVNGWLSGGTRTVIEVRADHSVQLRVCRPGGRPIHEIS